MTVDVAIASPLEAALVDRIRERVPAARVAYEPDLLPPVRYPSDHAGDPAFRRTAEKQSRYADLVRGAEVLFGAPDDSVEGLRDAVRASRRLHWVAGTAAGAGQQVRAAGLTADELARVRFTSSRGVHAHQLAEWALLGLLAMTKEVPRLVVDREAKRWEHRPVRELRGQRLLVVGLGEIGHEVARLALAFGMHVTGVRRRVEPGARDAVVDVLVPTDALAEVVPTCDAVVLALPGTPGTERLFSRELIDDLPAHAIIVNVGRGTTIDEPALIDALRTGRLAGAALDVTAEEPPPADSLLWTLDNVLLSPHTAALSVHENERIVAQFIANLRRFIAGEPLEQLVDTDNFY